MGHGRCIKIIIPLWIVVFLVAALPIATQADVPTLINYQGYLTDDSGTPLSGRQQVNFRLYSTEAGGFLFWEEEQLVEVTDGVFNVQLGAVNLLPPSVFNFDNIYLEIEIFDADSGWETLTPRQQFTSSAFAVRAGNADMLGGQTLSDLDTNYVNAGEVDAVTAVMIADNSIGASDLGDDSVGTAEIIAGAVGSTEIADGTITANDLADDYVNTTGDTITGNLNVNGDINTTGPLRMDGAPVMRIDTYRDNSFLGYDTGYSNTTGYQNTFLGSYAGKYNTTGHGNTFLGYVSGYANLNGSYNTFLGTSAGRFNTEGSDNTYVGHYAGYSNTTGNYNTFLGHLAGRENTEGSDNIFVGHYAGFSNMTGGQNTFLGNSAGRENTEGSDNIFVGHFAGYSNTTGYQNTFLGSGAGQLNTEGSNNIFVGYFAGHSNMTGGQNTFLGNYAGQDNTTGNGNTFIGDYAGNSSTTGYLNTFLGLDAGRFNTEGNSNTFIGSSAGRYNTEGYFNTFFGDSAGNKNTNGDSNTFLGYHAGQDNTSGIGNTFIGTSTGRNNWTGHYNTILGSGAGNSIETGSNNIFIGFQAGYNETGANKLYIDSSNTSTPLIHGDFSSDSLTVNGTLAVTDLTGTSSYNAVKYDTVTGSFYYDSSSDRYKEQIQDLEDDFHKILGAHPKTYVDKTSSKKEIGYIAEEFDEMGLNDLVIYNDEGLPNGLKYDRIPLYLVEVIKEQQTEIKQQQKTINALSERLTRLEKQKQ